MRDIREVVYNPYDARRESIAYRRCKSLPLLQIEQSHGEHSLPTQHLYFTL